MRTTKSVSNIISMVLQAIRKFDNDLFTIYTRSYVQDRYRYSPPTQKIDPLVDPDKQGWVGTTVDKNNDVSSRIQIESQSGHRRKRIRTKIESGDKILIRSRINGSARTHESDTERSNENKF